MAEAGMVSGHDAARGTAGDRGGERGGALARFLKSHQTEFWLLAVIAALSLILSFATDGFFDLVTLFDLANASAVNIIFAVGLLVVLIAGGIDISFAVAASVVQYVAATLLIGLGGGNWLLGALLAASLGFTLGAINALLIYNFRIISIIVTIATFNIYFGLLMFLTRGVSIYNLPDWWTDRIVLYERQTTSGTWAELTLPVAVMVVCVFLTWLLLRRTNWGRQLYAMGDNPEGARRAGVDIGAMHLLAYGWLGVMAGIAGLCQVNFAQEVVPNALYGRELDVLAAVVLGGARLGGGRGTILGCILGVVLVAVTQNGLNLLGVSPYAFKMVLGAIILLAILSSHGAIMEAMARAAGRRAARGDHA